ncbi:MAG: hypothetical protein SVR94_12785 [Pseudomonadota bacterium]|nr:hypothetical protein [Pseudomonadota bacterium]
MTLHYIKAQLAQWQQEINELAASSFSLTQLEKLQNWLQELATVLATL